MTLREARDFATIKFAAIIGEFKGEDTAFKFLEVCDSESRENVVCVDGQAEIYFGVSDLRSSAPVPITLLKVRLD